MTKHKKPKPNFAKVDGTNEPIRMAQRKCGFCGKIEPDYGINNSPPLKSLPGLVASAISCASCGATLGVTYLPVSMFEEKGKIVLPSGVKVN